MQSLFDPACPSGNYVSIPVPGIRSGHGYPPDPGLHGSRLFFRTRPRNAVPPATPATGAGTTAGSTVAIRNFAFDPQTLTIGSGTTVTWVNNDAAPHALASDTGSPVPFLSDSLTTGASFSFTFSQPGTYLYHCSIHPSMKGTIIVQQRELPSGRE